MYLARLVLISFCFLFSEASAQRDLQALNYAEVDSHARKVKYEKDIYKLVKDLTSSYDDPALKLRAIFVWMADNIAYDVKAYNKDKREGIPPCKGKDCEGQRKAWEFAFAKKTLKKKKAICSGYSLTFQKLCEIAGIKCEIVSGYTRQKPYQVGLTGALDHAWNAVWIDSSWKFLDVTWASGTCTENSNTGKIIKFYKEFNPYYYLTPFEDLFRNHYPAEARWTKMGYTKERFAANPYIAGGILEKIKLHSPGTGIIEAKVGDTIHFKFDLTEEGVNKLQINTNIERSPPVYRWEQKKRHQVWIMDTLALKKQKFVEYKKEGSQYTFYFVVNNPSLYNIDILFNYHLVMRFKIKMEKQL